MKASRFVLFAAALAVVGACSARDEFIPLECDPKSFFPSELCLAQFRADAGADAAEAGAFEPGPMPQSNCQACVPVPSGTSAGYWSEIPLSVRFDKPEALPKNCPNDVAGGVPNEKFRLFAELVAPPAECGSCACEPSEGKCEGGPPETIEIRAGTCAESGVSTLPFDGPAGWAGACTSANALPAGASCSGELCAQSVLASPLPGPTIESCAAKSTAPSFTAKAEWKLGALACTANTDDDACGAGATKSYCVSDPGFEWLYCVTGEGVEEPCPDNYDYKRIEMYPEKPIDDRGCEVCECGAPVGSACVGSLRLSGDAVCSSEFEKASLASTKEKCVDVLPAGRAIGAKAVTDVTYFQGTCSGSGGAPKGSASPNMNSAVTFCCRRSHWIIK